MPDENMPGLFDRYWINQPSTFQPLHHHHRLKVIAPRILSKTVTVYPISGPTVSMIIPGNVLSRGWE